MWQHKGCLNRSRQQRASRICISCLELKDVTPVRIYSCVFVRFLDVFIMQLQTPFIRHMFNSCSWNSKLRTNIINISETCIWFPFRLSRREISTVCYQKGACFLERRSLLWRKNRFLITRPLLVFPEFLKFPSGWFSYHKISIRELTVRWKIKTWQLIWSHSFYWRPLHIKSKEKSLNQINDFFVQFMNFWFIISKDQHKNLKNSNTRSNEIQLCKNVIYLDWSLYLPKAVLWGNSLWITLNKFHKLFYCLPLFRDA